MAVFQDVQVLPATVPALGWLHGKVLLVFLPPWLGLGAEGPSSSPAGRREGGCCVLARPLEL